MEVDDSLHVQRKRASSFSFGRRLAEAANVVGKVTQSVGEVITRTAASAGELLSDKDLRWKGTTKLLSEAQKGVQNIQKGVGELPGRIGQRIQQGAVSAIQHGGRPVQIVQRVIAKQLAELQRYNQLSQDSQPLVDIQIGPQVYEDMPQEMRSRLWYVILEDSHLVEPLRPLHHPNSVESARFSFNAPFGDSEDLLAPPSTPVHTPHTPHTLHPPTPTPTPAGSVPNSKSSTPAHRRSPGHPLAIDTGIELSVFAPATPDADTPTHGQPPPSPFMVPGAASWADAPTPRSIPTPTRTTDNASRWQPSAGHGADQHVGSVADKTTTSAAAGTPTSPHLPTRNACNNGPTPSGVGPNRDDLINLESPQRSIEQPGTSHRSVVDSPVLLGSPIVHTRKSVDLLTGSVDLTSGKVSFPAANSKHSVDLLTGSVDLTSGKVSSPAANSKHSVDLLTGSVDLTSGKVSSPAANSKHCVDLLTGSVDLTSGKVSFPAANEVHHDQPARTLDSPPSTPAPCTATSGHSTPTVCTPAPHSERTAGEPSASSVSGVPSIADAPADSHSYGDESAVLVSSPMADALAGRHRDGEGSAVIVSSTMADALADRRRDGEGSAVLVFPTDATPHDFDMSRIVCEQHPLAAIYCDSPQLPTTGDRARGEGAADEREMGESPVPGKRRWNRMPTEINEWEMVPSSDGKFQDGMQEGQLARHCIKRITVQGDEAYRLAVRELTEAMSLVPWPIPTDFDSDCKFATLNNITLGQEEVDEVIYRDINRTFPEHPYFGEREGQMCLFRILKAYSLHDLEVGYCQGMAFVAGILLMYLPEEPAFRLFCRLMSEEGPNMRRLYLPGLEPLKIELATLEYLLLQHMPDLHAHLREYGIPAVLYASQWFLTSYSCPFPHTFAARVLDIMLQDDDDKIIQRVAMSILKECHKQLMQLDDFEAIITCLKVTPVKWPQHQLRKVLNNALASQITDEELEQAVQAATIETAKLTREASTRHRRTTSLQRFPSTAQSAALAASAAATGARHERTPSGGSALPLGPGNPPPLVPAAAGAGPSGLLVADVSTDGVVVPDGTAVQEEEESLLDDEPLEEQFLNMIFLPGELDSVDIEADGTIDAVFGR